ncbi:flagellar regulator YcgR PilZN domain-containing protein [Chitinimonas sp.]|uniref:flagellar regulator YcgR PilZN domain-containing protein n=1 Tax=Chitinimonas sp. TaxID=1934313 RepID=UPI0035B38A01
MSVQATPVDKKSGSSQPNGVVLRDAAIISAVLDEIAREHCPLVSHLHGRTLLFATHLLTHSAERGEIALSVCDNPAANQAALASDTLVLHSRIERGQLEIPLAKLSMQDGQLRSRYPEYLVLRQRRGQQRLKPLPERPLQCVADEDGVLSFDAVVVDLSVSGLGALIYGDEIRLSPGTLLKGCRIAHAGGTVSGLDIEVLYADPVELPDGRKACRAGCRFVGMNAALSTLLQQLVAELKPTHGAAG